MEMLRKTLQVCTFRLVLKNAASLLENDDPVKLEATAALDNLIRYFRDPETHSRLPFLDLSSQYNLLQCINLIFE